jgi:anti-sigma factor RsiW
MQSHPDADWLTAYVLDNAHQELGAHIADCEQCAATVRELRQVKDALVAAPESEVPPRVHRAILSSVWRKSPRTPRPLFFAATRLIRNPALIGLGVAAAAVFLYLMYVFVS